MQGQSVTVNVVGAVTVYVLLLNVKVVGAEQYVVTVETTSVVVHVIRELVVVRGAVGANEVVVVVVVEFWKLKAAGDAALRAALKPRTARMIDGTIAMKDTVREDWMSVRELIEFE